MKRTALTCAGVLVAALQATSGPEPRLSTAGFGPARIGMTPPEAARALRVHLVARNEPGTPDCYYVRPEAGFDGLALMVVRGRVARFDITAPGWKTVSGFGVGDTEARIVEAFGASIEVTPHKYLESEGNYLTVWSADRRSAVRFETYQGRVTSVYAGRVPEVRHIEGCA